MWTTILFCQRAYKLRLRLGGDPTDDPYPDKPPRMRWTTYNRLLDKHIVLIPRGISEPRSSGVPNPCPGFSLAPANLDLCLWTAKWNLGRHEDREGLRERRHGWRSSSTASSGALARTKRHRAEEAAPGGPA
jgi:hypothetical protein